MFRHRVIQLSKLPNIHNHAFPQQKINPAATDRGNINKPCRYQSTYSSTIPHKYDRSTDESQVPLLPPRDGYGPFENGNSCAGEYWAACEGQILAPPPFEDEAVEVVIGSQLR